MGSNIDVSSTGALVNQLMNPPNPMDQLGKTIQGIDTLKSFQAKQAIAGAYQQSIDPQTGQLDQGKFNALMGQGNASWAAGPAMQQFGQAQGAEGTGTTNWVTAQRDQLNLLNGYAAPLYQRINQGGSVSADDVRGVLNNAIGITPQMRAAVEQKLAGLQPGENANGLLLGFQYATQTGEQQASRLYPTVGQNIDISKWLSDQSVPWPDPKNPNYMHYGTNETRIKELYGQPGLDAIQKGWGGGGYGPSATPAKAGAPGAEPETPPGSTPGAGNWEVQHNNFAGMRNPNVPAAGGPNTNPAGWQQFDTPEAGVQAISNQLDRYASGATTGKPLNTLNGIISTWAPPSENPTAALIARASKIMGVGPDQPLDLSNSEVKAKLVEAMIRNEQGGNLPEKAASAIPGALNASGWKAYGATGGPAPQPTPASFPTSGGGPGTAPVTLPETSKASGEQFIAARNAATTFSQRISPLEQAQNELRANVGLNTGPGAQDMQNLQGIARTFGINMGAAATDNNKAFSIINKDLETYYRNVPNANNSDLARIEAKAANPSVQLQREALDELTSRVIGAERMNNAAYLNFVQKHGPQASMYAPQWADEAAQYTQNLDPVGFAFDKMTPEQRTAYRNSLQTDQQRTNYLNSIKQASRLYNLPIPRRQ